MSKHWPQWPQLNNVSEYCCVIRWITNELFVCNIRCFFLLQYLFFLISIIKAYLISGEPFWLPPFWEGNLSEFVSRKYSPKMNKWLKLANIYLCQNLFPLNIHIYWQTWANIAFILNKKSVTILVHKTFMIVRICDFYLWLSNIDMCSCRYWYRTVIKHDSIIREQLEIFGGRKLWIWDKWNR